MYKMRLCENDLTCVFTVCGPLVFLNFCLSCDPFLGSVMSFILPVNIGVR